MHKNRTSGSDSNIIGGRDTERIIRRRERHQSGSRDSDTTALDLEVVGGRHGEGRSRGERDQVVEVRVLVVRKQLHRASFGVDRHNAAVGDYGKRSASNEVGDGRDRHWTARGRNAAAERIRGEDEVAGGARERE